MSCRGFGRSSRPPSAIQAARRTSSGPNRLVMRQQVARGTLAGVMEEGCGGGGGAMPQLAQQGVAKSPTFL